MASDDSTAPSVTIRNCTVTIYGGNVTVIPGDGQQPPDTEQPPDAVPPPEIPPIPNDAVWCPAGQEPADVVGNVPPGGTLVVEDGRYLKPFHLETEGIVIRSASGNPFACYFDGQGGAGGDHNLAWSKGMIHSNRSISVYGIGFRNCGSPASGTNYSNEAGAWIGDTSEAPGIVSARVQRCAFDNCGNGVFAPHEANVHLIVTECLFGYLQPNGQNAALNGQGGPAHDNYVAASEVEVSHCYFWGCAGHNVKSRSASTWVHDNPCMVQDGGRAFEAPDGGEARFENNTVHTRTDRPPGTYNNSNMLAYCSESQSQGAGTLTMARNTLHISRMNSTIWAAAGTIASSGDTVHYYGPGSLQLQGNVTGLEPGSAPPNAPSAPALPQPPDWAKP
jgi:hypothetical protein